MVPVLIRALYARTGRSSKKADRGAERHTASSSPTPSWPLARAPKSRLVEHAYVVAMRRRGPRVDVPDYALDKHTARGREMGRGMSHFYDAGAVVQPAADVDDPYAARARQIDERR